MAGRKENPAIRLVFPDDVRYGGGRQDRVLSDNKFGDAVGGSDLQDRLYRLGREETAIATDDECRVFRIDRVENGLDKIFCVVLYYTKPLKGVSETRECWSYGLLEYLDPANV